MTWPAGVYFLGEIVLNMFRAGEVGVDSRAELWNSPPWLEPWGGIPLP